MKHKLFLTHAHEAKKCAIAHAIDPFHVCGNAANLEDKTKEIFASVKQSYCSVLQIGCIPTDVKGVYTKFCFFNLSCENKFAP